MKTRFISMGAFCALLLATGSAGAGDATHGRGSAGAPLAPGTSARTSLDRRLAVALTRMDENLLALVGPASLDCAGDFLVSGMETCVARFDRAPVSGTPTGAVAD